MKASVLLVGLAGGSASGKTTLVQHLRRDYPEHKLCIISQDHYYKPLSKQLRDEQGVVNFDHPDGIDFGRIKLHLKQLKQGKSVKLVEYTFNNPEIFPREIIYRPAPIILLEGIFVFADPALKKQFNLRVFVHTDERIALHRRLTRDIEERGMDKDMVEYQWEEHVIPAYHTYLRTHRNNAHIVLDNSNSIAPDYTRLRACFDKYLSSLAH